MPEAAFKPSLQSRTFGFLIVDDDLIRQPFEAVWNSAAYIY